MFSHVLIKIFHVLFEYEDTSFVILPCRYCRWTCYLAGFNLSPCQQSKVITVSVIKGWQWQVHSINMRLQSSRSIGPFQRKNLQFS